MWSLLWVVVVEKGLMASVLVRLLSVFQGAGASMFREHSKMQSYMFPTITLSARGLMFGTADLIEMLLEYERD